MRKFTFTRSPSIVLNERPSVLRSTTCPTHQTTTGQLCKAIKYQLGPALSKRQCTAQVCFRPEPPPPPPASASDEVKRRYRENLLEQPPPCIIFRGTGKGTSQYERDAYPRELMVLWQPKAWCDRPIALEWAKLVFKKVIDADSAAGVCESEDSYLLIQDNLDSQKQPEYGTSTSSRSFKPTTTRPRGAAEQHGRH